MSDLTNILEENTILVPEFQKCKAQIATKFGCVPLTPIYVYKGRPKTWNAFQMSLLLIKYWGHYLFYLCIPLQTNLNVTSRRKHLVNYFNQQLPDLIEFGLPRESTLVNHALAWLYPNHIDRYIQDEVGFQAMLISLDTQPFDVHISLFMTRQKLDSNFRGTIMDPSFRKGLCVIDGVLKDTYLGTDFQMHFTSVDSIIQTLNDIE